MSTPSLRSTTEAADSLRDSVPEAFSRGAAQVQDLTRRSLERARDFGADLRDQVGRGGDRAVDFVRDEPVKALLVAAAAGAVLALLARAMSSRRWND